MYVLAFPGGTSSKESAFNAGDVRDVKTPARNESLAELCFETQGKIHTQRTTFMHHLTSNSFFLPPLPLSFLSSFFVLFQYNLPISNFVSFFPQLEGI